MWTNGIQVKVEGKRGCYRSRTQPTMYLSLGLFSCISRLLNWNQPSKNREVRVKEVRSTRSCISLNEYVSSWAVLPQVHLDIILVDGPALFSEHPSIQPLS